MLEHSLDTKNSILNLRPNAALKKEDFEQLAKTVDPYIEKAGGLAGIIIELAEFPGWETLGAMAAHFRFVRDHHKRVKKVALVTDAKLGQVAEKLASHFIAANVKRFPAGEAGTARQWITGGTTGRDAS